MKNRLIEIRKHYGLTQKEFGDRINLSQNFIWMLENGQRAPAPRTILDLCDEYDINEEWLRTGEGDMLRIKDGEEEVAAIVKKIMKSDSDFQKRFIKVIAGLSPDEWSFLERKLKELVNES